LPLFLFFLESLQSLILKLLPVRLHLFPDLLLPNPLFFCLLLRDCFFSFFPGFLLSQSLSPSLYLLLLSVPREKDRVL
jgi:hypothetical protein